jgi:hypothetical protein
LISPSSFARAYLDASRVIPAKADEYRRRGQQLLAELGAVVPEAERDFAGGPARAQPLEAGFNRAAAARSLPKSTFRRSAPVTAAARLCA